MRVHLLAPPNAQTTRAYSLDGFTMATMRFAALLKSLGHTVILYASEENEAPCDQLIPVISKEEQESILGPVPYQYAALENTLGLWQLTATRTSRQIAALKQPKDFICLIGGLSQRDIADAHPDLMTVEYSIGYVSSFSKYRVFESEAWRHFTYGREQNYDGRPFDAVIPLCFDATEFRFNPTPEPFLLYVGRLTPKKGLAIACEAAEKAGLPLAVIGHGDPSLVTHGAEYLGALSMAERNDWMARASALLCPTLYLEPFGSVAVEAQMCGTPVISTNFGAFPETVVQGVTGFRCDYLGEFVRAIQSLEALDRRVIHRRALDTYSIEAVAPQYDAYFKRLLLLWDEGWNTVETPMPSRELAVA